MQYRVVDIKQWNTAALLSCSIYTVVVPMEREQSTLYTDTIAGEWPGPAGRILGPNDLSVVI